MSKMGAECSNAPAGDCQFYKGVLNTYAQIIRQILEQLEAYKDFPYKANDYYVMLTQVIISASDDDFDNCRALLASMDSWIEEISPFDARDVISRTLMQALSKFHFSFKQNLIDNLKKACPKKVKTPLHSECSRCDHFPEKSAEEVEEVRNAIYEMYLEDQDLKRRGVLTRKPPSHSFGGETIFKPVPIPAPVHKSPPKTPERRPSRPSSRNSQKVYRCDIPCYPTQEEANRAYRKAQHDAWFYKHEEWPMEICEPQIGEPEVYDQDQDDSWRDPNVYDDDGTPFHPRNLP